MSFEFLYNFMRKKADYRNIIWFICHHDDNFHTLAISMVGFKKVDIVGSGS